MFWVLQRYLVRWVALPMGVVLAESTAQVVAVARLSMHQLPSYWGIRNRSVGACSAVRQKWWCATGSQAQVVQVVQVPAGSFTQQIVFNTSSAPRYVQAVQRMPNDRFLVPQYEGVRHTLYRPQRTTSEQNANTNTHDPKRGHRP
jgi:hypothetical protein